MLTTIVLLVVTAVLFIISLIKSREKTKKSLKVAKNYFLSIALDIIGVLMIISLILTIIPDKLLRNLLGNANEFLSILSGAIIGTITIIPAFIAFPLSDKLLTTGAHLTAIASFITTLTMVGFATLPIEVSYFGKRFAIIRNLLSIFLALSIALLIGVVL